MALHLNLLDPVQLPQARAVSMAYEVPDLPHVCRSGLLGIFSEHHIEEDRGHLLAVIFSDVDELGVDKQNFGLAGIGILSGLFPDKQKFYIFCYQTDRMREDRPTPDLNYLYRGRTKRRSGKEERE